MTHRLDRLEEIGAVAPQGINKDRRHASDHGDHAPDWVDHSGSGGRDPDTVEQECEGHILDDLPVTVTADLVGIDDGAKPLVENDHIGGFDCDVGPAAEGDADIGLESLKRG